MALKRGLSVLYFMHSHMSRIALLACAQTAALSIMALIALHSVTAIKLEASKAMKTASRVGNPHTIGWMVHSPCNSNRISVDLAKRLC